MKGQYFNMTPTQQRIYDVLVENPNAPFDEIMRKSGYKSRSLVQLTLEQLEIEEWTKTNDRRTILRGMDDPEYPKEISAPVLNNSYKSALKKDLE